MRAVDAILVGAVATSACSAPEATAPAIDHVEPPYGPLGGGTTVRVEGARFTPTTRVLVDGREAPLVKMIADDLLDVVIPPGTQPGEAELVALDRGGYESARGLFRYSEPPVITDVSPRDTWFASADTVVTLTGSGFLAEAAGDNHVLVSGVDVTPLTVTSDSTIQFVVPQGQVFSKVDIELVNDRGRALAARALRYTPGTRPGLLLFGRWTSTYAVFYDPADETSTTFSKLDPNAYPYTAVVRDGDGTYWGIDYASRVGPIDLATQTHEHPITVGARVPAAGRVGDEVIAIRRSWTTGVSAVSLVTLSMQTGAATALGSSTLPCCGNFGVATDGTTTWVTMRSGASYVIATVDPATGALGTPITLTAPATFRVEELRFFQGVLYAVGGAGGLARIDPATGVVTMLPSPAERFGALEVYE